MSQGNGTTKPLAPLASRLAPFDLDALEGAGTIKIFGREVTIRALDGFCYRTLQAMQGGFDFNPVYKVIARCVPDLTPDEIDRLTAAQMTKLLEIAGASINLLQESNADPNATGPVTSDSPPA